MKVFSYNRIKLFKTVLIRSTALKALLLFHLVFFISYRKVFFICQECIIGHNWDWGFPALDFHFRRLYEISLSTWFSYNFGSGLFLNISQLFPNLIVSGFAYVMPPKFAIILTLYLVHLSAFFLFKRLLDVFVKHDPRNYLFSFLYGFSPFLFNEIIGGSWYMWISFAAIPLFFTSLYEYVKKGTKKELTYFILSTFFVLPSLQNIVLIEVIFFLLFSFEIIVSKDRLLLMFRYLFAHFVFLLFNLYWILPFLTSLFSLLAYTSKAEFNGNFDTFTRLTQNILGIFTLSGYLDRNMYQFLFPRWMQKIWYTAIIAVWLWFLHSLKKNIKNKHFYVFLFIFLSSIMIVKGGLQPFSKLTLIIFRNVPLFSLYRSPQHLMLAPAFLIPLLLTYMFHLSQRSKNNLYVGGMTLMVFIWISGWLITGDLGHATLSTQKKDHVDFFSLSPDLKNIFMFNEQKSEVYRTLFIPSVISPEYLDTLFQNKAQGGQAEFMLLKSPTFSAEVSEFAKIVDNYFCFEDERDDIKLLLFFSLLNVKYLVLREDIVPKFTDCATKTAWDIDKVKNKLDQLKNEGLVEDKNNYGIYAIPDELTLPKLFITDSVVYTNQEVQDLPVLVSTTGYSPKTIFLLHSQNSGKNQFIKDSNNDVSISYKVVNQTQYKITVKNAKNKFILTFLDNYDSRWLITKAKSWSMKYFFPKSIVHENDHIVANGFANAWIIQPDELCKSVSCQQNSDGSFDFEIQLEFGPQKIFYLGAILSTFSVLLYIVWIVTRLHEKKT